MKALTALAVFAVAGPTVAQAATYAITGSQTSVSQVDSPAPTVVTNTPAHPTFNGMWDLTTSGFNGGNVAFDPFGVNIDVFGGAIVGDLSYTDAEYVISGGTFAYDAGTLTLTLTNAIATYVGSAPTCTGNALICSSQPEPGLEDVDLTLTFLDASLGGFIGTLIATNNGGANGNSIYTWNFTTQMLDDPPDLETPLPAAAWLFGSGLMGLIAAARRRC